MNFNQPTQAEFDRMYDLHQAYMRSDGDESRLKIKGQRLSMSCVDFRLLDLNGKSIRGMMLEHCVFGGELPQMDFRGAVLGGCCFTDVVMEGADFSYSHIPGASFRNAMMADSILKGVRAPRSSFINVDLSRSDCTSSKFNSALFNDSDLSDVDMTHANIRKTIFEKVQMGGVSLVHAKTEGAEFYESDVVWLKNSLDWAEVFINSKSMDIGERHGTHSEWFDEPEKIIQENQEIQDDLGFSVYLYQDWERWSPILKAVCDQLRAKTPKEKERTQYAGAVT